MVVNDNVFIKEKEIMEKKPTPRAVALLPVAVFLVLYLVLGIILEYVLKIESCKQKSIAEIKKSRKNCATEKGHDKTSWRKSFASRDKASI